MKKTRALSAVMATHVASTVARKKRKREETEKPKEDVPTLVEIDEATIDEQPLQKKVSP